MYALSHIVILYSCWHKKKQVKKREKKKKKEKSEKKEREEKEKERNKQQVPYRIGSAKLDENLVGVVQMQIL